MRSNAILLAGGLLHWVNNFNIEGKAVLTFFTDQIQ
jgi:hypothetical protein